MSSASCSRLCNGLRDITLRRGRKLTCMLVVHRSFPVLTLLPSICRLLVMVDNRKSGNGLTVGRGNVPRGTGLTDPPEFR